VPRGAASGPGRLPAPGAGRRIHPSPDGGFIPVRTAAAASEPYDIFMARQPQASPGGRALAS